MREFEKDNRKRNKALANAAAVAVALWLAYCIWLGFHGHPFKAAALGLLLSPVIYLAFAFFSLWLERRTVEKTSSDMFDDLNRRVGKFSLQDALAYEAEFNRQTPDNLWHDVNVTEKEGRIEMHVIHYWHDGDKRQWNSDLKMRFDAGSRLLSDWALRLSRGAHELTGYTKYEVQDEYEIFTGPL